MIGANTHVAMIGMLRVLARIRKFACRFELLLLLSLELVLLLLLLEREFEPTRRVGLCNTADTGTALQSRAVHAQAASTLCPSCPKEPLVLQDAAHLLRNHHCAQRHKGWRCWHILWQHEQRTRRVASLGGSCNLVVRP